MFTSIKTFIKKFPGIRKIVVERDELRTSLSKIIGEQEALKTSFIQTVQERDKYQNKVLSLISERDELKNSIMKIAQERDELNKNFLEILSDFEDLVSEHDELKRNSGFVPPGHYYSPIPAFDEIKQNEAKIFNNFPTSIEGINFHEEQQFKLLNKFDKYYNEIPFKPEKSKNLRYFFENPSYAYGDAIIYYCMIRHLHPKRIIEIGSGFSSCLALDTNELFFDNSIQITFIEPFPDLLISIIKDSDKSKINLIQSRLEDIDHNIFNILQANDILFVDSTHICKINSDVNHLFFHILPTLSSRVHVHFHDVFYPFEYPKNWVLNGITWNEAYLLRAFLQFNNKFSIVLMNTFMETFHRAFFQEKMPLCLKNTGGSVWIRKD